MNENLLYSVLLISITIPIVYGAEVRSVCGDDSWIAYRDEKCVKLFQTFATRNQAEEICGQQAATISIPTLVTIRSAAEQKFLVDYISNLSDSNNVWIGAERRPGSDNEFDWNDGSSLKRYSNWKVGYPTDDVRRSCVLMQSELSRDFSDMKWTDVGCTGGNWFICQKLQSWSMEHFQQTLLAIRRELSDRVPVGFIYVQLHNQSEPATLWSGTDWQEITDKYAGLFFRAEGQGSAAFGVEQNESTPRLTHISVISLNAVATGTVAIPQDGSWSPGVSSGTPATAAHWGINAFITPAEIRPRNTAMRIWIRVR